MSLRDFMNQRRRNPHYYLEDERGWVYCTNNTLQPNTLVGDGGYTSRKWKTERGAQSFADGFTHRKFTVKFSEFDP